MDREVGQEKWTLRDPRICSQGSSMRRVRCGRAAMNLQSSGLRVWGGTKRPLRPT